MYRVNFSAFVYRLFHDDHMISEKKSELYPSKDYAIKIVSIQNTHI